MAKIAEWEKGIRSLKDRDLERIDKALNILAEWPLFEREYQGLRFIAALTNVERVSRFMNKR